MWDGLSLLLKGASSGVLVMWNKRVVKSIGDYLVSCSFKFMEDGFVWAFACIYGPNVDSSKRILWDEIVGLFSWWICLGVLVGILMSLGFLVINLGRLVLVWP